MRSSKSWAMDYLGFAKCHHLQYLALQFNYPKNYGRCLFGPEFTFAFFLNYSSPVFCRNFQGCCGLPNTFCPLWLVFASPPQMPQSSHSNCHFQTKIVFCVHLYIYISICYVYAICYVCYVCLSSQLCNG